MCHPKPILLAASFLWLALTGCEMRLAAVPEPAKIQAAPEARPIPAPDATALKVPPSFSAQVVVQDLVYPTSVEFDDQGTMYIAEAGYAYGDPAAIPRIFAIDSAGGVRVAADRGLIGPITDLLWHDGRLLISHRGRISVLDSGGDVRDLVVGLPSLGDHHNGQLTAGRDGKIYFGQGTATNAGVVGVDNFAFGWLTLHPQFHDVPARDIRLRGQEFATLNPFVLSGGGDPPLAKTGAFAAFGSEAQKRVQGATKANGTILRMSPDGSGLEVYAWGLRNPFGVVWGRDDKLYATENGFDLRGSRPIANDTDDLYVIKPGAWYGWPDFAGGVPVTDKRFRPENGPAPEFLMAEHPPVERPLLTFPPHSAVMKIAANGGAQFGARTHLFTALWGPATPLTGYKSTPHEGHQVLRIDPNRPSAEPFVSNRQQAGGDKHHHQGMGAGLRRPVDVVFSRDGGAMYIVDMGVFEVLSTPIPAIRPRPGTGVVWRIVPEGQPVAGPPAGISVKPGAQRQPDRTQIRPVAAQ